jgi:nitrogen fixation NifU-like protein
MPLMLNQEISNLYQEIILEHYKNPRNFGWPECFLSKANGSNPSCGDDVTVYLNSTDSGIVTDINFECTGCAISIASASIMSENIKFKPLEEVLQLSSMVQGLLSGSDEFNQDRIDRASEIIALFGVRKFPMRIKPFSPSTRGKTKTLIRYGRNEF